ncbi:type VI secretion protein [Cupriavidus sp. USMAA2-4]|uniref:type VI secretion system protein TssA n=1 Tax=Cupriavidus sp. USMAA2-4 TaxID=876364 RepID=UPI0008A707F9|nr:type VI secretion system ImpA family N-terminal domain-containing protein [Cupriavidus sp. USMAA2-4]AOY90885.1 type VI secretion protein [Cupriavidus sp. USMAA2-4]
MKARTKSPKSVPAAKIRFANLALPVDAAVPCGRDLEYDPEFVVLMAKAAPRESAQYGNFVAPADPLNWTELERDCQRLLLRSKDIRLLTLFLRCRTRLEQAEGLRDGLALLCALLTAYPAQIHPQLEVDGEQDPALRANALAALTDLEGLLSDVREISLGGNATTRLQIRDIERALGAPRPHDALAPDAVRQQLEAYRQQGLATIAALDQACALAQSVQRWCEASLPGDAPDLSPLLRLLHLVGNPELAQPATLCDESSFGTSAPTHLPSPPLGSLDTGIATDLPQNASDVPTGREAAVVQVRAAREWFENHEPSSPVSLLLRQAEHLAGKPFAEVFQAIPPDLVTRWTQETP